jgi:hypothetical protein
MVERHGLGIVEEPHDPDAIAQAIFEVYRRREAGEPLRLNRKGIEEYDRKHLSARLAQILDQVASEGVVGSYTYKKRSIDGH